MTKLFENSKRERSFSDEFKRLVLQESKLVDEAIRENKNRLRSEEMRNRRKSP